VNLTALSLLALMVGLFLAYNTMTFSVVQRRATMGMLRALGVARAEIVAVVLAEALLLGLVATALGLGAGVALAGGLVRLVTRTINDLYFVVVVRDLAVSATVLAKGAALGIGATLLAALLPAVEASATAPGAAIQRAALEARARRAAPRAALVGGLVLLAGAVIIAGAGRSLAWSYAGLFTVILSAALFTPIATIAAAQAAGPPLDRLLGLTGRMAARGVVAKLSRTGVAVAALMVAVSATVGVGVMIRSFRATVERWLETSLAADVYVSAPSLRTGRGGESTLAPAVVERLRGTPGVASVGTLRGVRVLSEFGPTQLVALGIGRPSDRHFRFLDGDPDAVWPAFLDQGAAIVSEAYAYRHGLAAGRRVRLHTDRGEQAFPIAGVFVDYGSDQGVVMVSRRTYEMYWDDRGVSSLGIVIAPRADVAAVIDALRARAGGEQELLIRSNRALREASLEIFDRTFAITAVLRVLATAIAVIGVLSALMALQLERARELGVLRAQGLTSREVWRLTLAETGLLGAIAGALAVPVGIALALLLIRVINRRAFGWSIETVVPADVLLQAVGLAVLAALAAGIYPAWRMARTPPAPALREE
jgi:putative ABC transport system permease protein